MRIIIMMTLQTKKKEIIKALKERKCNCVSVLGSTVDNIFIISIITCFILI